MKSKTVDSITALVAPILSGMDAYLVEDNNRGERSSKILEVYADTDAGITADQLADISRLLSEELDRLDLFPGRYRLEVSSPGLGRPLKLARQYRKNVGRLLKVQYRTTEGTAVVEGTLDRADDTEIQITDAGRKVLLIALGSITEAAVQPKF
jgi:ribosome maturation factor RimP